MAAFDIVSPDTIASGGATDAYFERTEETLAWADRNPTVVAEVTANQFPTGEFSLLSGLGDVTELLAGVPVDVDALREGTLFDGGPVLRIEGRYRSFARYETSLLGFLSHASGMTTNALEARRAAPESLVLSFGSRHVHPSLGALVERSALIGGFDGFSNVAGGDVLGRDASGTMPHSLVICFGRGGQEAAWRAFHEAVPDHVPRVALCDTYSDEVDESVRAAAELSDDLDSVRIDTTASRRGDYPAILREVRWELDARGHTDVDIFASGGLTPDFMREARDIVDGFGVGSWVSNADPLDFALDIVEVEGRPAAKRGKISGRKSVYRTPDGGHHVGLADRSAPVDGDELFAPLLRDGEVVRSVEIDQAAKLAERDAERVNFGATG